MVAVVDWHSRHVLARQLFNTLDGISCLDAPRQAPCKGRPKIFDADQGAHFTADTFSAYLLADNFQVSMRGRGRALNSFFCERLWRTVRYECIYPASVTPYSNCTRLTAYFDSYNQEKLL